MHKLIKNIKWIRVMSGITNLTKGVFNAIVPPSMDWGIECSGAVAQRCSLKKVFLKISQNWKENTCVGVSFLIKLQAWGL